MALSDEQLLGELEDIIRSKPDAAVIRHDTHENISWLSRAVAAISAWDLVTGSEAREYAKAARGVMARDAVAALANLTNLIYEAHATLRLSTIGPVNTAIGQGMVFQYFDEIRKLLDTARSDIFVIDPYLDAEFVSRYLQNIQPAVSVRLLGRERMSGLVPAVQALVEQSKGSFIVKAAGNFHDRFLILDRNACYQSGASFKDGAKKCTHDNHTNY